MQKRTPNLFVRWLRHHFELRTLFNQEYLVEEPFSIAVEDFRDMGAQIGVRFAESIDDFAQVRFVNADHLSQSVLPDPACVHSEFQIRVDISID